MNSSNCLSASELALMVDRRASRRERKKWLSHLNDCPDCRMVLGEAASYVEQATSSDDEPDSLWAALRGALQTPALASAVTLLLVALLAVALVMDPMAWLDPEDDALLQYSTNVATAPLFRASSTSYTEHRWLSNERGLGFTGGLGEQELAFRIGVYLVDARIAIQEARRDELSAVVNEIETLLGPETTAPFRAAVENEDRAEAIASMLDGLEADARSSFDAVFFNLGIWSETARLAAAAENADFFRDELFIRRLTAFRELDLPNPTANQLVIIDDVASDILTAANFPKLQRELRQLILLH